MKSLPSFLALAALAAAVGSVHGANSYAPLKYQPLCNHGQALVDMEMAKHPELKLITVHVTPPGVPVDANDDRRIMFSSIGRIGKPDAGPDAGVFINKKEEVEIDRKLAPGGNPFGPTAAPKYEVLTPLLDKSGETIGLLVIVFPWKEGDDVAKEHKTAMDIRDELQARTANKDDLFRPAS